MNALLVCVATLVIVLRNSSWLNAGIPTRVLASVGNISYSLYLVHWPVIAFIQNAWVGGGRELPFEFRCTALLASFGAAYLLYRFIEDPIRRGKLGFSAALATKTVVASGLLMLITPLAMHALPTPMDFTEVRRTNFGLSEACDFANDFTPKPHCQIGDSPDLLVWGDSYAMHLIPGIAQVWNESGFIQATKSACGPLLGLAPRRLLHPGSGPVMNHVWAEQCIEFNQSVIDHLRKSTSIDTVVLASSFSAYVAQENYEHLVHDGTSLRSLPSNQKQAVEALRSTISEVRRLGKRVVLVAPPPSSDFDIGACLERKISQKFSLGGNADCHIDVADYIKKRSDVIAFLESTASASSISVLSFDPWLCDANRCETQSGDILIYRDTGHLSHVGSRFLAEKMQLDVLIRQQAR